MRSATRPHGELDNDYLVMREYVLRKDDPAARELAGLLQREKRASLDARPLKRGADLRRCWTTPSAGFRRYGLVDGSIPVIVVELGSNEVPVEGLFVVDGDEAVPALYRSRVFRIWAGATLPSASSLDGPLFSHQHVRRIPIVEPFRIVGQEGSLAALVAYGAPRRLHTLADEVGRQIERQLARLHSQGWKAAHELGATGRAMDRLNEMILEWYGLPKNASDIAVLTRTAGTECNAPVSANSAFGRFARAGLKSDLRRNLQYAHAVLRLLLRRRLFPTVAGIAAQRVCDAGLPFASWPVRVPQR